MPSFEKTVPFQRCTGLDCSRQLFWGALLRLSESLEVLDMNVLLRCALVLSVAFLGARSSLAQSTNSGDIRGTVMDTSGAAVPGVDVTLTNVDTGEVQHLTTNDSAADDKPLTLAGNYKRPFKKQRL